MEVSLKLENMEKHFNNILTLINDNQKIKRYLKYLSDDPLLVSAKQPNIEASLINENIVLSFVDEKILTENKAFLFFNLLNSDLNRETIGSETYMLDIIVPTNKWVLKGLGQFRVIRIAIELCKMLDQQKNIAGIGEIRIENGKCYKISDSFQGMLLTMTVGTSNAKTRR